MSEYKHFETRAIRSGAQKTPFREHSSPLFLTSSFTFEDAEQARAMFCDEIPGNIYSRFSNPNTTEFIEKFCALEGTEDGVAVASGMSAMFTSMAALLHPGDPVLASRSTLGSTPQTLTSTSSRWGSSSSHADMHKPEEGESLT